MAWFSCDILSQQILNMQTIGTASGATASFTTDLTENLVKCELSISSTASSIDLTVNGTTTTISLGTSVTDGVFNTVNGILTINDTTPATVVQLTPIVIATVSGSNSISCDTGNASVTYLETIKNHYNL